AVPLLDVRDRLRAVRPARPPARPQRRDPRALRARDGGRRRPPRLRRVGGFRRSGLPAAVLTPTFSIVIPLYNEEACVEKCTVEIVRGLDRDFAGAYELILVINGSRDRTPEICE